MRQENGMVFFWDGIFSQWHRHNMVIEGILYNTCEQYMMAEKARLFDDLECLELIMEATNPKEQKRLGRLVRNFDLRKWEDACDSIVYRGNFAKFSDPVLRKYIISFPPDAIFVEASPYDKIWGIGLHETDDRVLDPKQWQGQNKLGEALTAVRNHLLKDFCPQCNQHWEDHEFAVPAPYCPQEQHKQSDHRTYRTRLH